MANCMLCVLKIPEVDCRLKHIAYFLHLRTLPEVLIRLQCIKFRKIHMIIGIEDIGKRIVIILKLLLSIGENHR